MVKCPAIMKHGIAGLHMASHSMVLAITAAYVYARKHAHDECFSFGTEKVNSLAGFYSVFLLAVFALFIIRESSQRFISLLTIAFNQAILVAAIGIKSSMI